MEKDKKARALETIAALSAILGDLEPTWTAQQHHEPPTLERDSVAAWSLEMKLHKRASLADSMPRPSQGDPKSSLIADQVCSPERSESETSSESECTRPEGKSTEKTRVGFNEVASVVEIPSHRDMDPEDVDRLWTSLEEMEEICIRNSIEYNSCSRDWANVLEEHQMTYDPVTGEHIHPATWEAMMIRRQKKHQKQELLQLAQEAAEQREKQWAEAQKTLVSSTKEAKQRDIQRTEAQKTLVSFTKKPKMRQKDARRCQNPPRLLRRRRKQKSVCSQQSFPQTSNTRQKKKTIQRWPQLASEGSLTRFADT